MRRRGQRIRGRHASAAVSTGRQILKNAGALVLARGVTASLTLVTLAYLGRVLGPEPFGILGVGVALVAYFALPVNLGLNVYGAREVARDTRRVPILTGRILSLRLSILLLVLALYLATVSLLGKPLLFKTVLALQGLTLVGYAITLEWVFQGIERMGILAVRNVAAALVTFGLALTLVQAPDDLLWAAIVTPAAIVLANAWLLVTYWRAYGGVRLRLEPTAWKTMLRPGFSIMTSLFMISIYTHMDQLMLGLIRTEQEAGWYAASYRLLMAALIPADILFQAFLPALSSAADDQAGRRARGRVFVQALLTIGLPVALLGWALAEWLLVLVFGASYAAAGGVFGVLMLNAGVAYASLALGHPLLAWNRERAYAYALGGGAALNVVLNIALIPPFGMMGAALATLACQSALLVGVAVLHRRATGQLHASVVLRALLAVGLGVGGPVLAGRLWEWPPLAILCVAAVLYAAAALALKLIDLQQLRTLLRARRAPTR